jgi:hypothetical protein
MNDYCPRFKKVEESEPVKKKDCGESLNDEKLSSGCSGGCGGCSQDQDKVDSFEKALKNLQDLYESNLQ